VNGNGRRFTELVVPAAEVDAIDRRTFGMHHMASQLHVTAVTDQTGAPLEWRSVDTSAPAAPLPKVTAEPPVVVPAKQPPAGEGTTTSAAAAEPSAPQPAENAAGGGSGTAAAEATPLPDGVGGSGAAEPTSLPNGEGSSAAAAMPTPQPASTGNDDAAAPTPAEPTPPAPPATYQARGASRAPHRIHPPAHSLSPSSRWESFSRLGAERGRALCCIR